MKPRRVFLTIEVETHWPLANLRSAKWWKSFFGWDLLQVQANVAREIKPKKRKAKRKA